MWLKRTYVVLISMAFYIQTNSKKLGKQQSIIKQFWKSMLKQLTFLIYL